MSTKKLPKSNSFSVRIRSLRGDRKKADFARFLGIPAPVYQRYEAGRVPSSDNLSVISSRCGVSVDWLLGRTEYPHPIKPRSQNSVSPGLRAGRTVGIYGSAYCRIGTPNFYDVIPESNWDVPTTFCPPSLEKYERIAVFRAEDNSMYPLIEPGDLLFFSPDVEIQPGNVCIIKYDDLCLCKKYSLINDDPASDILLKSEDKSVAPILVKRDKINWIYRVLMVARYEPV